ncbi:MAG: hypothetical protein FJ042_01935 [Candidatus Cloacimonetes bacterium]|nr:hypothetical protein [Candidatus Cloacimonadota bacterium]
MVITSHITYAPLAATAFNFLTIIHPPSINLRLSQYRSLNVKHSVLHYHNLEKEYQL